MSDDSIDLGPCCMCRRANPTNIIMLDRRAAVPGHGWGCVQCGLPADGAVAVLCDDCIARHKKYPGALTHCCRGYPATEGRVAITDLPIGAFEHDMTKHPLELMR